MKELSKKNNKKKNSKQKTTKIQKEDSKSNTSKRLSGSPPLSSEMVGVPVRNPKASTGKNRSTKGLLNKIIYAASYPDEGNF